MIQGLVPGRIVHYHPRGRPLTEAAAALIIAVIDPRGDVELRVFQPSWDKVGGADYEVRAMLSETPCENCWSWPPRT